MMDLDTVRTQVESAMPFMSPARTEGYKQGMNDALALISDDVRKDELLRQFASTLNAIQTAQRSAEAALNEANEKLALVATADELDERARAAVVLTRELRDVMEQMGSQDAHGRRALHGDYLPCAIKAISYIVWAYLTGSDQTPERTTAEVMK